MLWGLDRLKCELLGWKIGLTLLYNCGKSILVYSVFISSSLQNSLYMSIYWKYNVTTAQYKLIVLNMHVHA